MKERRGYPTVRSCLFGPLAPLMSRNTLGLTLASQAWLPFLLMTVPS